MCLEKAGTPAGEETEAKAKATSEEIQPSFRHTHRTQDTCARQNVDLPGDWRSSSGAAPLLAFIRLYQDQDHRTTGPQDQDQDPLPPTPGHNWLLWDSETTKPGQLTVVPSPCNSWNNVTQFKRREICLLFRLTPYWTQPSLCLQICAYIYTYM